MSTINEDNLYVTLTTSNQYKATGNLFPAITGMNYFRAMSTHEVPLLVSFAKPNIVLNALDTYDTKNFILAGNPTNWYQTSTTTIAAFDVSLSTDVPGDSFITPPSITIYFEFRSTLPDDLVFNI